MTNLEIALSYRDRGLSVIPLWSPEMVKKNPPKYYTESLNKKLNDNSKEEDPLPEEDIIQNFSTGGTDKVQGAKSLILDLAGTTYISDQTSYNAAMRELDTRISLINLEDGYRQALAFGLKEDYSNTDFTETLHIIDSSNNFFQKLKKNLSRHNSNHIFF